VGSNPTRPVILYHFYGKYNDKIFEDRVHTVGNVYRKEFKTNEYVKQL